MNPFSAWYFIKENKVRAMLLMLMLFLSFGVYLGGLYIYTPKYEWELEPKYYQHMIKVSAGYYDENAEGYQAFIKMAEESAGMTVIPLGGYQGFQWRSLMGFDSGGYTWTFLSADNFRTFAAHQGIEGEFDNLDSGSMVMSRLFADNQGYMLGDSIGPEDKENVYAEFRLDAVTNEPGYPLYFITDQSDITARALIFRDDLQGDALYDEISRMADLFPEEQRVVIEMSAWKKVEDQFATLERIYLFVVGMLSVILAVTICASFVTLYQHRKPEFAVYRALGISAKRLLGKLVAELIWMDVTVLVIGGGLFAMALYLMNHLFLYPNGYRMPYFNRMAFVCLIVCNAAAILPMIWIGARKLLNADICEY